MLAEPTAPSLGSRVKDRLTGIEGTLIAYTQWHDRSDEAAICRDGVNNDGLPWDLHWFPVSRLTDLTGTG